MADPSTADVQAELKEYLNSKNINRCVRGICRWGDSVSVTEIPGRCSLDQENHIINQSAAWIDSGTSSHLPSPISVLAGCFRCFRCFSLFIQIVERLLIEKPDNPIGFIVEYLAKRYPDETRAARVGHSMSQREGSAASNATAMSR